LGLRGCLASKPIDLAIKGKKFGSPEKQASKPSDLVLEDKYLGSRGK
jgi:hypothetical protein